VVLCTDGQTAIERFKKNEFDICLLDVMMPYKDGLQVAKKIRQQSDQAPILFLTAKSMEEDKIRGFQVGGDDYITKPFSMKELLLRMEVFLKRTKKMHADNIRIYKLGDLEFSYTDLKIISKDGAIPITQKEADLLLFFCMHSNKVIKREEILLQVWGKQDYFLGRSMDVFVTRLRKHFKSEPAVQIDTIHGIGFRFNAPDL
jgi:DNA-binding response OmpR family regulator